MNIANLITLLRIILSPFMVILLATPGAGAAHPWIAAIIFILISSTDFLDGFIARKMNQVTTLGKLLDPLADKVLVISILIFFVAEARIAFYWVAIIIVRELAISSLRTIAALEHKIIKADHLGKAKTFWQYITITWMILGWPAESLFINIMILLTIISGINYFWVNKEVLRNG